MGGSDIVSDRSRLAEERLWGGECLPALSPPISNVIWTSFDRALVADEVCDLTEVGFLEVGPLTDLPALELGLNTSSSMLRNEFPKLLLRDGFIASALPLNRSVLDVGLKVSSKSRVKALPSAAGFIGLSPTNDELAPSTLHLSSSLSLSLLSLEAPVSSGCIFGKGRLPGDSTRLRFSFFGDGDTGSPRSRLRAREMAEGGFMDNIVELEGPADWIGGNGSGGWSRCEA
jgi:hypothetical protein